MDWSSPTNKRAREQPNQGRVNAIYIMWQRLVIKVTMFLRPVARLAVQIFNNSLDASVSHVRTNLTELQPATLWALRDDVDKVLAAHKDHDFELFIQYQNWKKVKQTSSSSSRQGSYVVVPEDPDKESQASRFTLESGYTHFSCQTGSRGRRLTTPSPSPQPRGPPPPMPVNHPQTTNLPTRRSGTTTPASRDVSMTSSKQSGTNLAKINAEKNAIVIDKMAQQEIFTQAYHVFEPNTPFCACRLGCKVEVSATTQNPNRVFYNCSAREPTKQCGFFQWAAVQPLLDDNFAETRNRLMKEAERELPARELLVKILQDACPHMAKIGSGSKAFAKRERCRACSKLLTVERRSPTMKSPTEDGSESGRESFDPNEYEAFLQWKKDRY